VDDPALAALFRAFGHPLRLKIARELGGGQASASRLAPRLAESVGLISYHLKVLAAAGAVELAVDVPGRGAVQHFYRLAPPAGHLLASLGWPPAPAAELRVHELERVLRRIEGIACHRPEDASRLIIGLVREALR
jgi:DNA-binding transcriptional ArsR family regulator